MTAPGMVVVHGAARVAFGAPAELPPGSFLQVADGRVLRVEADGRLTQLVRGGAPWGRSVAADPGMARGAR